MHPPKEIEIILQITTSFLNYWDTEHPHLATNAQHWSQDPYFHVQFVYSSQELLTGSTALSSIIFQKKSNQPNFIAMLSAFMVFGHQ